MTSLTLPTKPYPFGGITAAAAQNITSISNTNGAPVILTVTGHGYPVGATIYVRIATVSGQTALNADWVAFVTDANTITLLTLRGWANTTQIRGNGVASSSGTITRTPVPITINHPEFANLGIRVHTVSVSAPPGNTGTVYVGIIAPPAQTNQLGQFMKITTPFTDCLKVIPNTDTATHSLPSVNYQGANEVPIDSIFVDFATIGDVVLVNAMQV